MSAHRPVNPSPLRPLPTGPAALRRAKEAAASADGSAKPIPTGPRSLSQKGQGPGALLHPHNAYALPRNNHLPIKFALRPNAHKHNQPIQPTLPPPPDAPTEPSSTRRAVFKFKFHTAPAQPAPHMATYTQQHPNSNLVHPNYISSSAAAAFAYPTPNTPSRPNQPPPPPPEPTSRPPPCPTEPPPPDEPAPPLPSPDDDPPPPPDDPPPPPPPSSPPPMPPMPPMDEEDEVVLVVPEPPRSPSPDVPRERNFFVTYDPFLQPQLIPTKGKQPEYRYEREGLPPEPPKDPRRLLSKDDARYGRGTGRYRKEVYWIEYPHDPTQQPLRPLPPPPTALVLTHLPPLLPSNTLHRHLVQAFGMLADFTPNYDPASGAALGIVWARFASPRAAAKCMAAASGGEGAGMLLPPGNWLGGMAEGVRAEWDEEGSRHRLVVREEIARRSKLWEEERRRRKEEEKAKKEKERKEREERVSRERGKETPLPPTGESTPAMLAKVKSISREEEEKVAAQVRQKLRENRKEHVVVEGVRIDGKEDEDEVRRVFERFGVADVFCAGMTTYVTFQTATAAKRAHFVVSSAQSSLSSFAASSSSLRLPTTFSAARLSVADPPESEDASLKRDREEVLDGALKDVTREMKEKVRRDVREKLVRVVVRAQVKEARAERGILPTAPVAAGSGVAGERKLEARTLKGMKIMKKEGAMRVRKEEVERTPTPAPVVLPAAVVKPKKEKKEQKERQVKKKEAAVREVESEDEEMPGVQEEVQEEAEEEEDDDDVFARLGVGKRRLSVSGAEDAPPAKRRKRDVSYTSSEGEDEDESTPVPPPLPIPIPLPVASRKQQMQASPTGDSHGTTLLDEGEDLEDDFAPPAKKRRLSSPPAATAGPVDIYEMGLAEDEEDAYYLRTVLCGAPEDAEESEKEKEAAPLHPDLPVHRTGCARTEGFYKIPEHAKASYLPQRNKASVALPAHTVRKGGDTSRANRNSNRVAARGLAQMPSGGGDVLKFNQLRTRKKELKFARSPIHDWGLYALEYIPAGDMVIEYVGEVVRVQVAEKREKQYERMGIGSSYLFRVDDDLVVDATKKGNVGRLINHCCTPNCTAKIIKIQGVKKIVIYAQTNIEPGEEITYDYHFPLEQEKIPCLCGSERCRGFLN